MSLHELATWMPVLLSGLLVTVELTVATSVLSVMLAAALAICRIAPIPFVRMAAHLWVDFFRSIPVLALLLFTYYGLGKFVVNWPLPSLALPIAALTLSESAYLSEVYRGGLQAIPAAQVEAAESLGFRWTGVIWRVVLPQFVGPAIPSTLNAVLYTIKDSALASLVGVPEATLQATSLVSTTFEPMQVYLVLAVMYLALIGFLTAVVRGAETLHGGWYGGRHVRSRTMGVGAGLGPGDSRAGSDEH